MQNHKPQNDASYFPFHYIDSRQRFLDLVHQTQKEGASVQIEKWMIPSKIDQDLSVDLAYWAPTQQTQQLLVVTSGIHGSETYAGSAILQMFLTEVFPKLHREGLGVLLVHAMNPYGFKYHRRTTENGVNLNRNFSISGERYKRRNEDSEKMHAQFFKREKVGSIKSHLFQHLEIKNGKAFFGDISMDQFIKAVSPGQCESAQDLEFGGKALEPQSAKLVEKLKELIPQYQDVVALDLHTGLGHRNRLHLLTSGSGEDLHPDLFAQLFDIEADKDYYEYTPAAAEGFYEVHGALNTAFSDLAQPHQRVCAITMEFGTLGHDLEAKLRSLDNLLVEHQGFYNGYNTPELAEEVQKESFERSYPQDDKWRQAVVAASRGLFQNILSRAGAFTL
ncbi:M14 family metallopeptidase [Pseudobdellovibrio exovorus]|uniref:DUF2817 domain-containing protein n=1 Tax=Pseudobdellovibrio exovorus JSS TaxID=1184267 RepID=M4VBR8_9BACT|nr:M14 family metallopeptidase [Pseudobdellovibrio exovorus]AGH96673.1 hypothetical protein A11Q_2457 [Pseudobdellovibrio exovorus JSS]